MDSSLFPNGAGCVKLGRFQTTKDHGGQAVVCSSPVRTKAAGPSLACMHPYSITDAPAAQIEVSVEFTCLRLSVEQPIFKQLPDHFRIPRVMLFCRSLEKSHPLWPQDNCDLGLLMLERQLFRRRQEIRHRPDFADCLVAIPNSFVHKCFCPCANSPHRSYDYGRHDR